MKNQVIQSHIELICDEVSKFETKLNEYDIARHSMLVNYGERGRKTDGIAIDNADTMSLWVMIEKVLTHYHEEIVRLQNEQKGVAK